MRSIAKSFALLLIVASFETIQAQDFTLESDSLLLRGKLLSKSNSYRIEITNLSQNTIVFDTLNFHFELLTNKNNDSIFYSITNSPNELNLDEADKISELFLKHNESFTKVEPLNIKNLRVHFCFLSLSTISGNNNYSGQTHSIKLAKF